MALPTDAPLGPQSFWPSSADTISKNWMLESPFKPAMTSLILT